MWGFLLQTLTVSLVAALILIVKRLLQDKLSPRWQYGVWSVLALRVLIPVSITQAVLLPLPFWLEIVKESVERHLHSVYSSVYMPISVVQFPQGAPQSVTDWLFVVYTIGVIVSLLWYFFSYVRLRMLLRKGVPGFQEQIQAVCERYDLKPCRVVQIHGLPSAFVCGVTRPVLAVPADTVLDDKIILHELLHLKYFDSLQNILWNIFRSLHWCNPFLQYVFHRIGNDMESLCDQRVLERLEGEERREYGSILLQMANDRYARAPGTTSISNGGKNIARRIDAIVRFKKYPKGMALVSVCIVVVLMFPCLLGTAHAYDASVSRPGPLRELDAAMAYARIERCDTVAGALDTYAKGLLEENGVYLAMASSLSRHEELEAQMRYNSKVDGWVAYHYETYDGLECVDGNSVYQIFGLTKTGNGYSAWLLISVYGFLKEDGLPETPWQEGFVIIPVSINPEDGWVVEETGERIRVSIPLAEANLTDWEQPFIQTFHAEGEYGSVLIQSVTRYFVEENNTLSHNPFHGGTKGYALNPDGEFQDVVTHYETTYTPTEPILEKVSVQVTALKDENEDNFRELDQFHGNGGDSEGCSWFATPDNGPLELPMVYEGMRYWDLEDYSAPLPGCYKMQVYHADVLMETLTLTEVPHG